MVRAALSAGTSQGSLIRRWCLCALKAHLSLSLSLFISLSLCGMRVKYSTQRWEILSECQSRVCEAVKSVLLHGERWWMSQVRDELDCVYLPLSPENKTWAGNQWIAPQNNYIKHLKWRKTVCVYLSTKEKKKDKYCSITNLLKLWCELCHYVTWEKKKSFPPSDWEFFYFFKVGIMSSGGCHSTDFSDRTWK